MHGSFLLVLVVPLRNVCYVLCVCLCQDIDNEVDPSSLHSGLNGDVLKQTLPEALQVDGSDVRVKRLVVSSLLNAQRMVLCTPVFSVACMFSSPVTAGRGVG